MCARLHFLIAVQQLNIDTVHRIDSGENTENIVLHNFCCIVLLQNNIVLTILTLKCVLHRA